MQLQFLPKPSLYSHQGGNCQATSRSDAAVAAPGGVIPETRQ